MKRSIICVAILLLVFMFAVCLPAAAEEGYPDLSNLQIDENGMMTWDEYEGAVYYHVYYSDSFHQVGGGSDTNSFNAKQAFLNSGFKSGDWEITVKASSTGFTDSIIAVSSIVYHYVNENECPDPTGLYWDGYILRWDDMGENFRYSVWFYEKYDGTESFVTWDTTANNYYDMSSRAEYKDREYSVGVVTWRSGWADSDIVRSEWIQGRFTLKDISLSLSGDILSFSDFYDDEGNAPGSYYLMFDDGEHYTGASITTQSVNFKQILQNQNAAEGCWEITGYAHSPDGVTVSNYSNSVFYRYGDPNYYMIIFDPNGGGGRTIDPVRVEKGDTYIVTDQEFAPPTGYIFDGWYTEEYGKVYSSDVLPVSDSTGDITLVAQWKLDSVHAEINGDIAEWDPVTGAAFYSIGIGNDTAGYHGGVTEECSQDLFVMCAGYDLDLDSFGQGTYIFEVIALDSEGREITGPWSGQYTYDPNSSSKALIVFDNNGEYAPEVGQQPQLVANKGDRFDDYYEPSDFALNRPSGKVFVGWYYDAGCEQLVRMTDVVSGNTKVYAKWKDAIDRVELTYPVPVPGMTYEEYNSDDLADRITLPSGEYRYEVDDAVWLNANHDTYEGVIQAGETYYLAVYLMVNDYDCQFAYDYVTEKIDITCIANGSETAITTDGDPGYLIVYIPYTVRTGWQKIDGEWYYYNSDGTLLTNGWAKDSKGMCWMGADGRITKSKWIKADDGYWYYLKANGYRATNEFAQDSKGTCYMGSDGKAVKSKWVKVDGSWYYIKANSYMAKNEFAQDSTGTCYMGSDGKVVKNKWVKVDGYWYYMKSNGYMAKNEFAQDSKGTCYMGSDGRAVKDKWVKVDGYWYYIKPNGYMARNEYAKDSKGTYYMGSDGRIEYKVS